MAAPNIETILSMPFAQNSYIVWKDDGSECFVVDPGFEPELILAALSKRGLRPVAILNTHGHADHIAGNGAMKDEFPGAPLIIGIGDQPMLADPMLNLSALGGVAVVSPPADQTVREGDVLDLLGLQWLVREIPGHSPGHVVFIWNDSEAPVVLGGDVLFAGGIGRFDFPGGDGNLLVHGIRQKLYSLPDQTIVYPGHGEPTTIGEEKATNPFTRGNVVW